MTFLHPILLASGLAAVAIPILIHLLLRRRRRPVRWAAMRFLIEAHRNRRRRRRIEQILLLIARCLLVAMLAVAIARPVFDDGSRRAATTLVIIIDNSLTSSITDETGEAALDAHKRRAIEQIDRLSPARGDRVAVISAASPPESIVTPATLDHDAARRRVDSIRPTSSAADVERSLALATAAVPDDAPAARLFIASEWRRGVALPESPAGTSEARLAQPRRVDVVITPPAEDNPPNLRLTSLAPGREAVFPTDVPAATQAILTIEREGDSLPELELVILTELLGSPEPPPPTETRFTLPAGRRSVPAPIAPDFPGIAEADLALRVSVRAPALADRIEGDSAALRTLRLRESARVGIIHTRRTGRSLGTFDAADWARIALRPDPLTPVRLTELNAAGLRAADLAGLDAAVVTRPDLLTEESWRDLAEFVDRGSTLLLFPQATQSVHRWPDRLAMLGVEANVAREPTLFDSPALLTPGDGADALPMLSAELAELARGVNVSALLGIEAPDARVVLRTERGDPVLMLAAPRVWLSAASLDTDWTDLPAKPLVVPLFQEIARSSAAPPRQTTFIAGTPPMLPPESIELVGHAALRRIARDPTTGAVPPPADAGLWIPRNARGERLGLIAVTPDHAAGRTAPTPAAEVLESLARAMPGTEPAIDGKDPAESAAAHRSSDEGPNWIPFLIAALLALLELAVARSASTGGKDLSEGSQS